MDKPCFSRQNNMPADAFSFFGVITGYYQVAETFIVDIVLDSCYKNKQQSWQI